MKKRLFCLTLALLFLFPLLVSCSDTSDEEVVSTAVSDRTPVSLNMWLVTEDETTDEAKEAVEAAFNEYTEANYTTHVNLIFSTKAEYKKKLDGHFSAVDKRPDNISFKSPTTVETQVVDGVEVIKYPEPNVYQTDIVLILGRDMLMEYIEEGRLQALNDSLTNNAKLINTYVYNDLMNNSKVDGTWYAIPNNHLIGEYTYLLVNREMADKYYYTASDFSSFGINTPAAELIDLIAADADAQGRIAPMLGFADYPLLQSWSRNGGQSVISTFYDSPRSTIGTGVSATNIFSDKNYKSFMEEMFYCKENGYFKTAEDAFGVGIVRGDYSVLSQYAEDYYVSVLAYPRLDDDDVFSSMFAVTNYTTNLARSMEIITALSCKTELRNLLQYGIAGTHYELDDNGVVSRLNHDYMMNVNYTGNVLLAYPEEGCNASTWSQYFIAQNLQSMLSVVCGTANYLTNVDKTAWQEMSDVSAYYFDRLTSCQTKAEFESYLTAAANEISSSKYYTKLTNLMGADEGYDLTSINGAITAWWEDTYGILAG